METGGGGREVGVGVKNSADSKSSSSVCWLSRIYGSWNGREEREEEEEEEGEEGEEGEEEGMPCMNN